MFWGCCSGLVMRKRRSSQDILCRVFGICAPLLLWLKRREVARTWGKKRKKSACVALLKGLCTSAPKYPRVHVLEVFLPVLSSQYNVDAVAMAFSRPFLERTIRRAIVCSKVSETESPPETV